MKTILRIAIAASLIQSLSSQMTAHAQGTAFTYQGRLNVAGGVANGSYDISFTLYATNVTGIAVAGSVTNTATTVSNGLFMATVDFGPGIFTGNPAWLELAARTNGGGAFTTLAPRQPLTPAPYAITAANVSGRLSAANLTGTYSNAVTLNNSGNSFSGSFTGNGVNLANVNAAELNGFSAAGFWQLGGNYGNGGQFLGSSDSQPLKLLGGGQFAMQLAFGSSGPNVTVNPNFNSIYDGTGGCTIAGGAFNSIQTNSDSSFIGGGVFNAIQTNDFYSFLGSGYSNSITMAAPYSFLGAGVNNSIQANAYYSFLGGGYGNSIQTYSDDSFLGGGDFNSIQTNSPFSFLGGGDHNSIQAGSTHSFLGGGGYNIIQTNAYYSVLGGGGYNSIQTNAFYSVLGGGLGNFIQTNATYSFLGGGSANYDDGAYSVVPGGYGNYAGGQYSFAAGQEARANYQGDFVWADSQSGNFNSTGNDQFCIRAQGGVGIGTGTPAAALNVATSGGIGFPQLQLNQQANDYSRLRFSASGYSGWDIAVQNTMNFFAGGWGNILVLQTNGNAIVAGTVTAHGVLLTSDRNAKENFTPLNPRTVLAKVAALPVTEWNYKTDDPAQKHIGPMAQDFQAAFQLSDDDKHISVVDEGGVALAAIQGLNEKLETENAALKSKNDELAGRLTQLEALVKQLAAQK